MEETRVPDENHLYHLAVQFAHASRSEDLAQVAFRMINIKLDYVGCCTLTEFHGQLLTQALLLSYKCICIDIPHMFKQPLSSDTSCSNGCIRESFPTLLPWNASTLGIDGIRKYVMLHLLLE